MGFKTDDEGAAVVSAIKRVMGRQFRSLSWHGEKEADWNGFAETFLPGASRRMASEATRRRSSIRVSCTPHSPTGLTNPWLGCGLTTFSRGE
jgi:hypothetical protein